VVGDRRCFNPSQVRLKPPNPALAVSVLLQSLTGPSETPRVLPVLPTIRPLQSLTGPSETSDITGAVVRPSAWLQSLTGPSETFVAAPASPAAIRSAFNPSQVRLKPSGVDGRTPARLMGRGFNPSQVRLKPGDDGVYWGVRVLQSLTGPSETDSNSSPVSTVDAASLTGPSETPWSGPSRERGFAASIPHRSV